MKLFSHSTGRLVLITVTVAILLSLGSCSKNKKAVYNLEGTMILDVKQSTGINKPNCLYKCRRCNNCSLWLRI